MSNKNQVIIRAPEQQEYRNPEAILNPKEVRQWLDTLPILNPDPTVRQITEAIESINLQKITAKKRNLILHEYWKTVLQTYPSLSTDALNRYSLKEEKRNQLQVQTTRLCIALADGYKIIIRDALKDGSAAKNESIFLSLYHAMEALSLATLNCYRTYKTTPKNLYQDIHQIYLLSEHLGLLNHEMDNNYLNLSASSIGNMYRQIMTLAFLDPFHMPSGIAERLYDRLSRYAEYCTILSRVPDQDSNEIFAVDLTTDEAPRAIYKISTHKNMQTPRLFDTHPLTNKIKAEVTVLQSETGASNPTSEIQLLNRLIPPEKEKLTRKAERIDSDRSCKVTFGIDAVYHFLTLSKQELTQVLESSADNFGSYPLEPWTINNESKNGFSLTNQDTTRHDVRVGDLIGLLSESSSKGESQGRIATIKWIQNDQDHHINIGVELIHGNILPAVCRLTEGSDANKIFSAIFISSDTLGSNPATLLTPKSIYRRGQVMEVTIADHPMKIAAGFLRDDTFTFDRFDFTSIKS